MKKKTKAKLLLKKHSQRNLKGNWSVINCTLIKQPQVLHVYHSYEWMTNSQIDESSSCIIHLSSA